MSWSPKYLFLICTPYSAYLKLLFKTEPVIKHYLTSPHNNKLISVAYPISRHTTSVINQYL